MGSNKLELGLGLGLDTGFDAHNVARKQLPDDAEAADTLPVAASMSARR